jgi:hypothetical protein
LVLVVEVALAQAELETTVPTLYFQPLPHWVAVVEVAVTHLQLLVPQAVQVEVEVVQQAVEQAIQIKAMQVDQRTLVAVVLAVLAQHITLMVPTMVALA